ncbi:hypothetical protein XENOCAPTIV_008852, partial [Xenoophorus captivus]
SFSVTLKSEFATSDKNTRKGPFTGNIIAVACLRGKRRTDQSTVTENGNNTEMFSAKRDGVYSVIQFVPAGDCPTGPGKPIRETSQNDDSDVYHVYCTVPDFPSASTRMM